MGIVVLPTCPVSIAIDRGPLSFYNINDPIYITMANPCNWVLDLYDSQPSMWRFLGRYQMMPGSWRTVTGWVTPPSGLEALMVYDPFTGDYAYVVFWVN